MLIASAAGGTGSGSLPIMAKMIKERFFDKPIYALIVLPFEHEGRRCVRTFYNTATCLKSVYSVADAVFLVDNQRYIEKDSSLINNMSAINKLIVEPFYDLLCAGEQKKFWEYHDKLYENQKGLNTEKLKEIADTLGLETGQFDTCLDSGKYASEVDRDVQDGTKAGVSGTPAVFINGIMTSGAYPLEHFTKIIDQELGKKGVQ